MSHEEGDCVAPLAWGCGDQADWHLAGRKVWRHSCSLLLWVPTGSLRHTVSKWRGVKSLSAALFSFSARVFFPWDCLWVSVWGCTTELFHRSHHILSFLFLYSVSCGWFSVFLFFSTTLAKVFILVSLVCRQGALFPCLPMYSKVSFRQYALLPVLTVQNVEVFWSMCSLYLWMSKQQHFYFLR